MSFYGEKNGVRYCRLDGEPLVHDDRIFSLEVNIVDIVFSKARSERKMKRNWQENGGYMFVDSEHYTPRDKLFAQKIMNGTCELETRSYDVKRLSVSFFLYLENNYLESFSGVFTEAEEAFIKWTKTPSARRVSQNREVFVDGYYFINDAFVYTNSEDFWFLSRTELQNAIKDEFAKLREFLNNVLQQPE